MQSARERGKERARYSIGVFDFLGMSVARRRERYLSLYLSNTANERTNKRERERNRVESTHGKMKKQKTRRRQQKDGEFGGKREIQGETGREVDRQTRRDLERQKGGEGRKGNVKASEKNRARI